MINLWTAYDGYPDVVAQAHSSFVGNEAKQLAAVVWQFQPRRLIEIGLGWTTHIMLATMPIDGTLTSYALDAWAHLPSNTRWQWVQGDARNTWAEDADTLDLLVIDAEHSADFAHWCQSTILPGIRSGVPVMVHDWLPGRPADWNTEEALEWDMFLAANPEWQIDYAFGWDRDSGLSSVWMHKE